MARAQNQTQAQAPESKAAVQSITSRPSETARVLTYYVGPDGLSHLNREGAQAVCEAYEEQVGHHIARWS